MTKINPVHVDQWGTFITTSDVSDGSATINLEVTIANKSDENATIKAITRIFALDASGNKTGNTVGTFEPLTLTVPAREKNKVQGSVILKNPKLWGPPPTQIPNRYVAVTTLWQHDKAVD